MTSVAVLPFENASGDPEQDYLAHGFVEDLAVELSRFATLEVVHPHSSLALESVALPAAYLLRGSVRRLGDAVRVAARLLEAGSGRQVWADRFDAPAEELLAVQDEIVARVASALVSGLDSERLRQARRKPLSSLEVYDCWLRGLECLRRGTVEDDARARAFFERALALDPTWARAHAGISLSHFNEWSCQAWELWDEKERLAYEAARRAAELDDRDALVQLVLGRVLLYRRRFEEAARHVDRALELNPSDADVLAQVALCRAYLGDGAGATALADRARRLNPGHPPWYAYSAAVPLFVAGNHAAAVDLLCAGPGVAVDQTAYLAAAWAHLGEMAQARAALATYLAEFEEKITFGRPAEPGEPLRWLLHVNPFRNPGDVRPLVDGLRRAGLPADPDEAPPRAAAAPPRAEFRREADAWRMVFDGTSVLLGEAKGFLDLAELLARPGAEVHCLELAGRSLEPRGDQPVLDARARRELAARVRELQAELDDAEARHDPVPAERAREELEAISAALAGALGLQGRERRLGSAAERARTAVTWRIRNAIRKIAAAHPALGRHLENAIRTGTTCSYLPERAPGWVL